MARALQPVAYLTYEVARIGRKDAPRRAPCEDELSCSDRSVLGTIENNNVGDLPTPLTQVNS